MSDSDSRATLFLVDGSAIFYRAYFAFIRNPLINSRGENTSATFGYINSLLKIIRDENPDYLAVVFDTKAPTFRHEMYEDYKSTRAKMPDELVDQLPRIRQATEALNIPGFEFEGFEADDVIGTFAKRGGAEGLRVWCVTGDKDFYQLVDDNIGIYTPGRGGDQATRLGREEVKEKFGVYPERVIDKLALMGDSSDNVPGIAGVGPKTADKLLDQFGSLDAVLEEVDQIKAKGLRKKVTEGIESARLSRKLVTIDTDVPIELNLEALERHEIDYEKTKDLFLDLEFNALLKEVMPDSDSQNNGDSEEHNSNSVDLEVSYQAVSSIDELRQLVDSLRQAKEIAIDTETTSLVPLRADLVGISLCAEAGRAWYVPLGHTPEDAINLPRDESLGLLRELLTDRNVQKFGQNIKYDLHVLRRAGLNIDPISFDTMLASYVIDPSSREHSLNFLALKHCDHKMQPISDLIGTGRKQVSFATVPIETAAPYAAEDADFTYRLRGLLAPTLVDLGMENLYYNVELPLIPVLADMEAAGVRVDVGFLADLSVVMDKKIDDLRARIWSEAGQEFNLNSTQQLAHILFDELGLPTRGKTAKKTGFSTGQRVLEELATLHELPRLILEYRQFTKLQNTYVDAIPVLVNPETGRVHTSFNQTVAATGRLSSTDPNLQNIPVRTEEGREIRRAFVARDDDHILLVADYSQIELRILAHYSEDPGLIRAFAEGKDIHTATAAAVYGVGLSDVTPEQRRAAKTANFAVIYGVSAYGLSMQSDLDMEGAKAFIDTYFRQYPGIQDYMERTKEQAREQGYVTTLLGRRRYLPEIKAKNFNVRQFAERTAINTPIQGTAADMIKVAMIRIHDRMKGLKSGMILQVHDELVFDVHREELDELRGLVVQEMVKAMKLRVPIVVDTGLGDNWLEAK